MDILGNLLMLFCYLFVYKCNVKKMMIMCVEVFCKIVVFIEWRIYIKSSVSIVILFFVSVVFENIENWLGGYKFWLCFVLYVNCKKCVCMNCWLF